VKVGCELQCEVAGELELHPGTVSRIVAKVHAWRGAQAPEELGEPSYAQERRVSRWLAQERVEEMYVLARRLVEEASGDSGFGARGSAEAEQETGARSQEPAQQDLRRMGVRLQAIKTALKAALEAHKLAESEPPPAPDPAQDAKLWQERTIDALAQQRMVAEQAGTVPKSFNPYVLVESLLAALVGGEQRLKPDGMHGPGSAYWQVAEALVSGSRDDRTLRAHYGAAQAAAQVPGAQVPGAQVPGAQVPGAQVPGAQVPGAQVPGAQAPGAQVPGAQVRNFELRAGTTGARVAAGSASAYKPVIYDDRESPAETVYPDTSGAEKTEKLRAQVGSACRAEPDAGAGAAPAEGSRESTEYSVQSTGCSITARSASEGNPESAPHSVGTHNSLAGAAGYDVGPTACAESGPARQAGPTGGIEVVGSPEWKVARARWLKERDQRRIDEALRRARERAEREADLRERRAAAAARRGLEAGRVEW
jgi:hypothetical protein